MSEARTLDLRPGGAVSGPSDLRIALLLFAGALLARVVCWMGTGSFGPDGANFLFMADWMREGRFQDALALEYHPLYPMLVSVVSLVTGSAPAAGFLLSIGFGAAAIFPLCALVRDFFGRPAAFLTGLIYAFSSPLIEVQSDVMTDAAFMFFFFSTLWLAWRMAEEPGWESAVALAMAAAAAFLTRPEGLICLTVAVGWPLFEVVRRGPARAVRVGQVLLMAALIILFLSPFLFWVRSMRGHWGLSYRPSAMSVERSVGVNDPKTAGQVAYLGGKVKTYRRFGAAILRLNLYGALFPFHLAGLAALRRAGPRRAAFYLLVLLGYLGGVLNTLRKYDGMSDRYLMPPMAWMWALAGAGLARTLQALADRWPSARWRPAAATALVLAATVLPGLPCLFLRRQDWKHLDVAAAWVREQGGGGRPMACSRSQINYLAGCRELPLPPDEAYLRGEIRRGILYVLYAEKDLRSDPGLVAFLNASPLLQPPVEVPVPPGTEKVFAQRLK